MTDPIAVELGPEDAEECLRLYREYGWWDERSLAEVERALENTSLAVGLCNGHELVAAARVLTDFVYYAKIYDVIVVSDRRDEGVGQRLLRAVLDHPKLADLNPTLMCRAGLAEFYEGCGFEPYPESVEIPEAGHEKLRELIYKR